MLELYTMPARQDVTPVSGYITFPEALRTPRDGTGIRVSAVQDGDEESNEVFTVRLLQANGGATIAPMDSLATITGQSI